MFRCCSLETSHPRLIYMEFRKMVTITLYAKQKKRHRCIEQTSLFFKTASLVAQRVKHLPAMRETRVQSLGWEDPLEKEMATHSSTLAWKIPWTEETGRLQSMGPQRVRHDWATSLSLSQDGSLSLPLLSLFLSFIFCPTPFRRQ